MAGLTGKRLTKGLMGHQVDGLKGHLLDGSSGCRVKGLRVDG